MTTKPPTPTREEAAAMVLATLYLADRVAGYRKGWGRKVHTTKKFYSRELDRALKDLKRKGVI